MITVQNRRRKTANILKDYPGATIVDLTSKGEEPMVRFSPFYPLGNIPIPFSDGRVAASVEGIWQGLKVFAKHDVDETKFAITSMKGLKRTVRKYGTPKGHRKGVQGAELLDYITARKFIYLPVYQYVLDNHLREELKELRRLADSGNLVLLDYETNGNVEDASKPLSHAHLVRLRLMGQI